MNNNKRKREEVIEIVSSSDDATTDGESNEAEREKRRRNRTASTQESLIHTNEIPVLPQEANAGTLRLRDVLGTGLKESWQINYAIQLPYLLHHVDLDDVEALDLHMVSSGTSIPTQMQMFPHKGRFRYYDVAMQDQFGSHHTKMMINMYRDDTLEVVIHTANLQHLDWEQKTQGLWRSGRLQRGVKGEVQANDIGFKFKSDLIKYLEAYRKGGINDMIEVLNKYNFSSVKAIFVGSVPGTYSKDSNLFGLQKLRHALRTSKIDVGKDDFTLAQASAISSITKDQYKEFQMVLSTTPGNPLTKILPFKLIFPTVDEVQESIKGWASGGSIFFNSASQRGAAQLELMRPHLCRWKAESTGRTRVTPHIKSYMRIDSSKKIKWCLVTSANVSKQAWGYTVKKTGALTIASYEAGVLLLPERHGKSSFTPEELGLPYDLPPTPYSPDDKIWSIQAMMDSEVPDWLGATCKEYFSRESTS